MSLRKPPFSDYLGRVHTVRTTATSAGKKMGMFGWRMRLPLAAVLAGIIGLVWLQGLGPVDAQGTDANLQAYVTVVVADDLSDPGNPSTSLTITFSPVGACTRGEYNAYISNWLDDFKGIAPRHLGSAATDATQITSTISNLQGEGLVFDVEVFCGTDSGLLVSWAKIPHDNGHSSTESNRRLVPGTYSSEPSLTSLTVSPGTLTPTFHSHTTHYTAPDLTNTDNRVTLMTTAKTGYNIIYGKASTIYTHCPWASGTCTITFKDSSGNAVDPLTDADTDTPGFQVDIAVGENKILMYLYEGAVGTGNNDTYSLTVTRAVNTPATGAPTISGTAQAGQALTVDTSGISDADGLENVSYSYQWLADGADIAGATSSSYTLAASQQGKTVQVQVSFTDDADNEESLTSEATAAVAAAPTPLTASIHNAPERHDGENSFTFELRFSETPRDGFSFKTLRDHAFTVTGGDVVKARRLEPGKNIRWEITVTPSSSADVTITLPATTDCDNQGAICTGDGRKLSGRVEVSVSAPNNVATGAPTISGTVQVDETLTAGTAGIADEDGLTNVSYSYQWLADGEELSGSTGSTYTLVSDDEGKAISVAVSFTDDAGNDESLTSDATDAVEAKPNTPATGAPAISGTAQVGETLTANTSAIADEDGLDDAEFSYQWLADGADISGATDATYTLAGDDEGKAISVAVSFTDDGETRSL